MGIANDHITESEKLIKKQANIIYAKSAEISANGKMDFIYQLYDGEPWNRYDNPLSVQGKADACFGENGGKIRVYLVETENDHKAILKLKTVLRELYGIGKHSVHITDTRHEAELVAKMVFNDNSLHLINNALDWKLPEKFAEMFAEYRKTGDINDDRCVDSSSVLAVYGLRDANDIDYLHRNNGKLPQDIVGRISDHNPHAGHYKDSIDEIITNPSKHLYYCGYKFASLEVVRRMKINRNEEKDKKDVQLIKNVSS